MTVDLLRQLRVALMSGEPVPTDIAEWGAAAIQRYLAGAAEGLDLGRAFGLVPEAGREAWWTREAMSRRDAALRALHKQHFPDLAATKAAAEIEKLGRAYQTSSWRFDRHALPADVADPRKALLREALDAGRSFPGKRHIERILRHER
jgi:hypothetical protein